MAQKKDEIYNGKNGMLYVRTDSGGIALNDAIKELYGNKGTDLKTQYSVAMGADGSPDAAELINQYSSALKAAESARANEALQRLDFEAEKSDRAYDEAARELYAGKALSSRAMANTLASTGLYNSGYADSARIALENRYAADLAANEAARRNAADEYRLAGLEVLGDLAVANAGTDAKIAELTLDQFNADRGFAESQQRYLADIDAAAWEREQAMAKSKTENEQKIIADAYAAAEVGDFSKLDALGIDTALARTAYQAELELVLLRLAEAQNAASGAESGASGGSGGSASSSGGAKPTSDKNTAGSSYDSKKESEASVGTYETEFAKNMAGQLVKNMQEQGKTYSEVLNYINSIREGSIKQFGQAFWDIYVDTVSKTYPGGSGYTAPEEKHLSSMKSIMDFINDSKNAARFFTESGYNKNAIRQLINSADLSEAERNELRAYYGLNTAHSTGKVGNM